MIKLPHQTKSISIFCLMREDLGACAQLHKRSFSRFWTEDDLNAFYVQESVIGLIAKDKEAVVGFILGMICGDRLDVLTVAVDPLVRRKGVAQSLFRALYCLCLDGVLSYCQFNSDPALTCDIKIDPKYQQKSLSGVSCIDLEVSVDNISAINLYEKIGFVREGTRKNYFHDKKDRRIDAALYRLIINHLTHI